MTLNVTYNRNGSYCIKVKKLLLTVFIQFVTYYNCSNEI